MYFAAWRSQGEDVPLPHGRRAEPLDKAMAGRKILSRSSARDTLLVTQRRLCRSHNPSRGEGEETQNLSLTETHLLPSSVRRGSPSYLSLGSLFLSHKRKPSLKDAASPPRDRRAQEEPFPGAPEEKQFTGSLQTR